MDDLERLLAEGPLRCPAFLRMDVHDVEKCERCSLRPAFAAFVRAREASAYGKGFSTVEDRYDLARHERDALEREVERLKAEIMDPGSMAPRNAASRLYDELTALRAVRDATSDLIAVPAVRQVLGITHTDGCKCPMCRTRAALAAAEKVKP